MPTSLRLAIAELRAHPGRAVLPAVALLVGVACLLATLLLSDAMARSAAQGARALPAGTDLVVLPEPFSGGRLDQATADRIAAAPGVRAVVPERRVELDLLLDDGRATEERTVADVDPDGSVAIAQGRPPAADGEIAVDRVTAHRHHLVPGGLISIADAEGRPVQVVVSGITERGATSGSPTASIGPALAARVDPQPVTTALAVQGGALDAVDQAAGPTAVTRTAATVTAERGDATELWVMLLPFSLLALATAVFVASATFRAVYLQRQRTTALLRCLGAFRGPLLTANLVEALISGALAGLAGALLSGPLARALGAVMDGVGLSEMFGAVDLAPAALPSPTYLVIGVVTAAVLSAVAALRPSLSAARVAPLAALRTADGTIAVPRLRRRLLGGALLVSAVALGAGALVLKQSAAAVFLVFFSSMCAATALFGVFGPVVVPALSRVFGAVATRLGGPAESKAQWKLATAEVRRVPQRAASVALPLLLASAMVSFFAVTAGTTQTALSGVAEQRPDAQVADTGRRPLPPEAVAAAENAPEVRAAVPVTVAEGAWPTTDTTGARPTRATVMLADPTRMRDWLAAEDVTVQLGADEVLLASHTAGALGVQRGDTVTLNDLPGGPRTARFTDVVDGGLLNYADAVFGTPDPEGVTRVLVSLRDGADPDAYQAAVAAALPDNPTTLITTLSDWGAETQASLDQGLTLLMLLMGLSAAVAVTGIGTALTISVQERRKELALRRALGVTRGGLLGGVLAEAVLLALTGLLGGGLFGTFYAELLLAGLGLLVWPSAAVAPLLVGGSAVLALAVLSALAPARSAARIRPAAGLSSG
ncbi:MULTISPECIES: FtsX-like permease family protein [Actinosynnema]|uniref:FtsX-like permease family protein n=1 Tax=Actinosynnema TaxID=40566 RepID=UPI0020A4EB2F|nr:FtsX-like permease family protein [Actinosynnema pretiosum]MCP2097044.1 putative ABC transport system permease protein [Actinosynnema pretiosum]